MDEIEAGYTTPPNREDSEQVADQDQSEPDEQGEKEEGKHPKESKQKSKNLRRPSISY